MFLLLFSLHSYKVGYRILLSGTHISAKGDRIAKQIMFSQMIRNVPRIQSIVELGCNIGLNLRALKTINSNFEVAGYEINKNAVIKAKEINVGEIFEESVITKIVSPKQYDLSFTSGVLIHINPDELGMVYDNLFNLSKKYILISEYYNPTPVMVEYRGHTGKLFKRDFAGEMIDKFDLKLIDYGFFYHRNNYFSFGDSNWFLLEK
jgi:pseudaminic acid biosynthesis-associated methylase